MSEEPKPAATVVVIRDASERLEVLLLERNVGEGAWVFPGGRIEQVDHALASDDLDQAARDAAVREAREEAALELSREALVPISRWITPKVSPRRYDTWFFLCSVERDIEVRVDGSEIRSHRWLEAPDALAAHHRGEMPLAPPTFVTVSWLAEHARAADAIQELSRAPYLTFRPRIHRTAEGACILYPEDAGYEANEMELPGPRHRLWMRRQGWSYERSPGG